jgi:hypothetical protein
MLDFEAIKCIPDEISESRGELHHPSGPSSRSGAISRKFTLCISQTAQRIDFTTAAYVLRPNNSGYNPTQ